MTFNSKRRAFLKASGGAAATAFLAGCSGDGGSGDGGSGSDGSDGSGGSGGTTTSGDGGGMPSTLRIGHPSPARPVYNVPIYSTFLSRMEEMGTTIEPVTFKGFTSMVAGMVSGEVDFGYVTPPALIKATNQGFPIAAFYELSQAFTQQVITQPDIESWEDLRGETLVAHSPQSFSALVLKGEVRKQLGSIDAVNYKYIIGTPNRLAAMRNDETPATTVFTSGAISAENEGYAKRFRNPNEDFDHMSLAMWTTLRENLNESTELYSTIAEEMGAAYEETYSGDAATIVEDALNSPTSFPEFGADVWEQTLGVAREDSMWPQESSNMLTADKLDRSMDLAVTTGLIDEKVDPGTLTDRQFLG